MSRSLASLLIIVLTFTLAACNASSSSSSRSSQPVAKAACADGLDNDNDALIDFPDDPGCSSASDRSEVDLVTDDRLTRYQMSNACWVVKANGNGQYLVAGDDGYSASALLPSAAEAFYLKPTALGKYMLYNSSRDVLTVAEDASLGGVPSAEATDNSEWTVLGLGDTTEYPATPIYNREPTAEEVTLWHGFVDPQYKADAFTITATSQGQNLAIDTDGNLVLVDAGGDALRESFSFESVSDCAQFPEAQSNFSGTPFKGTQPDGTVLGHADVHVHISATEFLGGGHWGYPFHKFGVEHALPSCDESHGPSGHQDFIGGLYTQDADGHATDGWPTFSGWPERDNLTHEAIYWKWLERAWAGGLRVVVNDLVDNETLCELQRNAANDPLRDCNSMNNAGEQAGTMYAMENYIDAQYGGPGEGFFQIVHSSAEAREVIEDGKIAVVLGIEISNLFDCKLTYNPGRSEHPFDETGSGGQENSYGCTTEEGLPNSILTQMQRIYDWGVRQVISIHEFDNAFGGNGIFDGLLLNIGNRENSGGIPSGDLAFLGSLVSGEFGQEQGEALATNLPTTETATGEWWTTYDCPVEGETEGFSGYLWGDKGGSAQTTPLMQPLCIPTGQDRRSGGTTPCYPRDVNQCNARWMTPAGQYTYGKMMEMGFIFDFDHMAVGMKTQALELAEAQNPVYPFVSTHGTFGGITIDQATRLLANGGFLYPSNGTSGGFITEMDETAGVYSAAMTLREQRGEGSVLFGFGYGTDTNGLSAQSDPRNDPAKPISYPFSLFQGAPFSALSEFTGVGAVEFQQPNSVDADGAEQRTWHEDVDGNAHYGMLTDFVQEIVLDGSAEHVKHLYNSAEAYLQTWERTEASSAGIQANGLAVPAGVLRPAPPIGEMPK